MLSLTAQDFENPADANADNVYTVTVRAVDGSGNTATQTLTVTVTDAVENIGQSIAFAGGTRVLENFGFQGIAYLAKTPVGAEKAWRISGADARHFELLKERRIWGVQRHLLRMKRFPNYEDPQDTDGNNIYEVTLTADGDDDGNAASRTLEVEVVDQHELRTLGISGLSNTRILKNTPYTSARLRVSGNPVGRVTWDTEGADAWAFRLDASNGVLSMAAQEYYEDGDNAYDVTVRVTDEDDNTATRDLTITVVSSLPPPTTGGGGGGGRGGSGGSGGGGGGSSRDDHGNTASRATRIPLTAGMAGQLNTTRDVDYFTLTAPHAGVVVVATTGTTDTRGTVWQDGAELARADSGGAGRNFRLAVRVEAGPVVIAVRGNGRQTGRYTLRTALVVAALENPQPRSFQEWPGRHLGLGVRGRRGNGRD